MKPSIVSIIENLDIDSNSEISKNCDNCYNPGDPCECYGEECDCDRTPEPCDCDYVS